MARRISSLDARAEYQRHLLRALPGLSPEPFQLFCNHCDRLISSDMKWLCSYCGHPNHRTEVYSFLNKCQQCKQEPKSLVCPHCGMVFSLDVTGNTSQPARQLTEAKKQAPPENPEDKDHRDHASAVRKRKQQIELAELDATLAQTKASGEMKKGKTAQELRREKIAAHFEHFMGGRRDIKSLRKQAAQDYKDDPDSLRDANEILDRMSEEDL